MKAALVGSPEVTGRLVGPEQPVGDDDRLGPGPPGRRGDRPLRLDRDRTAPAALAAYALAIVAGGLDLAPRAWRNLRAFRLDIHVLMGAAILGAIALGQWDEAATVAFLFGLSESLEALSVDRARQAVRPCSKSPPDRRADRGRRPGRDRRRRRGRPGGPGPGPVGRAGPGRRSRSTSGRSSVDQKAITGESVAILREVGDAVYAGSVNGEGALEVEASGSLDESLISRVADRVREAQAARAPVERTVERFAAIYTPAVVVGVAGPDARAAALPPGDRPARPPGRPGSPAGWSSW